MKYIDPSKLIEVVDASRAENPHADLKIARNHRLEHEHFIRMIVCAHRPRMWYPLFMQGGLQIEFAPTVAKNLLSGPRRMDIFIVPTVAQRWTRRKSKYERIYSERGKRYGK